MSKITNNFFQHTADRKTTVGKHLIVKCVQILPNVTEDFDMALGGFGHN